MDFLSLHFLFLFLPIFLAVYLLIPHNGFRNYFILLASLIFYAQSEKIYGLMIIIMIGVNYPLGRVIQSRLSAGQSAKIYLGLGVVFNIGVLLGFKLLNAYSPLLIPFMPRQLETFLDHVPYPLGLSYLCFQFVAYLADIFRNKHTAEKNIITFSLYIFLFPKLIVGPITRYAEIRDQIMNRILSTDEVAAGIRRFIIGFAKKIIIADQLGRVVNGAFAISTPEFSTGTAWFVLVAFALQIYFDFSAYMDMALGLARITGFKLPENFDQPYISKSVSEFWRRWHITLSSWFREYVFYPLERNRLKFGGQQINILIVFLLTGLWHGETLPFVMWGLIHGAALALESSGFGRTLKTLPSVLQHAYTLAVVLLGWIFFRAPTLTYAGLFLIRLTGLGGEIQAAPFSLSSPLPYIENSIWLAFGLGLLFATPLMGYIQKWVVAKLQSFSFPNILMRILSDVTLFFIFFISLVVLIGASYKPGIYGGF